MDDLTTHQRRAARIISFETFLQRTWGTRRDAGGHETAGPFGHYEPPRPLTERQINHRQAMLKHMLSSRWVLRAGAIAREWSRD